MTERNPADALVTQADREAMESILWVDTIIDDQEAIAKAFARHRIAALQQQAPSTPDAVREAMQNALDALESASGFILAKHGSYNPAREDAIAGLRIALGEIK